MPEQTNFENAKILISRLERLSADSYWAHRASGIRGALLKRIEINNIDEDTNKFPKDVTLDILINIGYALLEKAAREIPDTK